MDKRLIIPLFAAVAIAAACYWKVNQTYPPQPRAEDLTFPQPAPIFILPDQKSQQFRFQAYLGRHEIFIVFYDGEQGVEQSEVLNYFRTRMEKLDDQGIIVIGISQALPQQNIGVTRTSESDGRRVNQRETYPFPLLTDLDGSIHKIWGRYDEASGETLTGTFFVDRAGDVEARKNTPAPLTDPLAFARKTLGETDGQ